jgi:small subunit ribosomal protein S7
MEGIKVDDQGLQRYITLAPRFVPKTGARYAGKKFHKSRTFVIERLINKVMIPGHKSKKHFRSSGHNCGKGALAYRIVMDAFRIVEDKTKQNPVKVFVKALENAAPREEIVTIEYGGARYPKAVDCAPQRRVDVALRYFVQGAYDRCFNKKTKIKDALAEEIMLAFKLDPKSLAIAKKGEIERQADSSR